MLMHLQSFQILTGMIKFVTIFVYFKMIIKIGYFTFSVNKVITKIYAKNIFV